MNFTMKEDILFERPGITILFSSHHLSISNKATCFELAVNGLLNIWRMNENLPSFGNQK